MDTNNLLAAINVLSNPSTSSASLNEKNEAQAFLDKASQYIQSEIMISFKLISDFSSNEYVLMWLLSTLEMAVKDKLSKLSNSDIYQFVQSYWATFMSLRQLILSKQHLQKKYALICVLMIRELYPEKWPTACKELNELLSCPFAEGNSNIIIQVISFVFTIFEEFDKEVIAFYESRTAEDNYRARIIKDQMRIEISKNLSNYTNQVISNYKNLQGNKKLLSQAINIVSEMVDWNEIDLFISNLPFIIEIFHSNFNLQGECLKCIHSFIDKGTPLNNKISLLENLKIYDFVTQNFKLIESEDEDSSKYFAYILNTISNFFLNCFASPSELNSENIEKINKIFPFILECTFNALEKGTYPAASIILEFLDQFVHMVKQKNLYENYSKELECLLIKVINKIQFPTEPTLNENGSIIEEQFLVFRNEISTLFNNLCSISKFYSSVLSYIGSLIQNSIGNWGKMNIKQKELPLYLINIISVTPLDIKKIINDKIDLMLDGIFSIPNIFSDHFVIRSLLYEISSRYSCFFTIHKDQLKLILNFFFSQYGIFSSIPIESSKSSYNLFKICDKLKNSLKELADPLFEKLLDLGNIFFEKKSFIDLESIDYIMQCIGIIASLKIINVEKRVIGFRKLIDSILGYLQIQNLEQKFLVFLLKISVSLTKSFDFEVDNNLKCILENIALKDLEILKLNLGNKIISELISQYILRMSIWMGDKSINYCEMLCESLSKKSNDLFNILLVIQNVKMNVIQHGIKTFQLIIRLFPSIQVAINNFGIPVSAKSDIEKDTIELETNYVKLIKLTTSYMPQILFEINESFVNDFLQFLFHTIHLQQEYLFRKTFVEIALNITIYLNGFEIGEVTNLLQKKFNPQNAVILTKENSSKYTKLVDLIWFACFKLFHLCDKSFANDILCIADIGLLHYFLLKAQNNIFLEKWKPWIMEFSISESDKNSLVNALIATSQPEDYQSKVKTYREMLKNLKKH